jgi:hypothetical protein
MGVNKVIYGGRSIMDITDSTVTTDNLDSGVVAYNAAGERIVGAKEAIQGIVREYKALGEISANGFVQFANEYLEDTPVLPDSVTSLMYAFKLAENRVFFIHNNSEIVSGMIITINGAEIILGEDTPICDLDGNTDDGFVPVLLTPNKVLVAYATNSKRLYAVVATIENSTITVGASVQLTTTTYSMAYAGRSCGVKLTDNKAFFALCQSSASYKLYGIVMEVDGTTVTAGALTQLVSSSYSASHTSVAALIENKVLITHSLGGSSTSNGRPYAMVVTIDGNTFSAGTDTALDGTSGTNYALYIRSIALDESRVFACWGRGSSPKLNGMVITVDGTSVVAGTRFVLWDETTRAISTTLVPHDGNRIFIAHADSDRYLWATDVTISNIDIEVNYSAQAITETSGTAYESSAVMANPDMIFIVHSYSMSAGIYAILKTMHQCVTPYKDTIYGVALNGGSNFSAVNVVSPE